MSRIDRRDVAEAVLSGAVSFAWYALPDIVPARRTRGWLKAALTVPLVALGVAQSRRAVDGADDDAPDGAVPVGATVSGDAARDGAARLARVRELTSVEPVLDPASLPGVAASGAQRAVLVGAGLLVAAGGALLGVVGERAIFRYGERLAARGVRRPHTRIGVVAGLAAGGLSVATATLP